MLCTKLPLNIYLLKPSDGELTKVNHRAFDLSEHRFNRCLSLSIVALALVSGWLLDRPQLACWHLIGAPTLL